MMQPPPMADRPAPRELILHHFELSPFAEKIRLMLGCKAARWRSVHIPMLMPKPDVLALTGGYRRTPLLQIGADVWCDSALIARVLDRELGGASLFPATQPLAAVLAQWADWTLFWSVIDFASQPACLAHRFGHLTDEQRLAIAADRNPFRASVPKLTPNDAGACLAQYLQSLESQLASGHECVCGDLSIADFSMAHVLWHLRRAGPPAELLLAPFRRVLKWHDRMLAFGHGQAQAMSSEQALQTAAQAMGHEACSVTPEPGLTQGQTVSVAAVDYGHEASWGELVGLNALEVVIARSDVRAGRVHVHFPRVGFRITPA